MLALQRKMIGGISLVALSCLALALACHAQAPPATPTAPAAAPASPPSQAQIDAEHAEIWNSPDMLRARAWLLDYCNTSKKCKPGDAEKYTTELENLSPIQMKLWLMKFDEEEERKQQQRDIWQQAHAAALQHAQAANRATQKSYSAIDSEETAAANQDQQQLNYEQNLEDTESADKQLEAGDAYNPGLGYFPGDGVHYHFHLYGP